MLNLDTHILLDAISSQLSQAERRILERDSWCISAIVLWEIERLAIAGRIAINLDTPQLRAALDQIHIVAIDAGIARSVRLLDFRSDPADEVIAATSIQLNVPLLTRDQNLLRSRVVPLIRT